MKSKRFIVLLSLIVLSCVTITSYGDEPIGDFIVNGLLPSAESGDAESQCILGHIFSDQHNSYGIPNNDTLARQWYLKAAKQGHPEAQNSFGMMYAEGRGGTQSYKLAREWWQKAAHQGHEGAQFNLGRMYGFGVGVSTDIPQAEKWFLRAAMQGFAQAQMHLGVLYFEGVQGVVPKNNFQAYYWLNLAYAQRDDLPPKQWEVVRQSLDQLNRSLTSRQISEAQTQIQRFKPKKENL